MIDETFWNTTLTWNITSLLFVYINCVLNEVDKVGWYRAVEKFDDFVLWGIFAKLFFEYLHKICFKVSKTCYIHRNNCWKYFEQFLSSSVTKYFSSPSLTYFQVYLFKPLYEFSNDLDAPKKFNKNLVRKKLVRQNLS